MRVRMIHNDNLPTPQWAPARLAESGIDFAEQECSTAAQVLSFAGDADVIWLMGGSTVVSAQVLNGLDRCWAILRSGAGTDNVPVDEATQLGVVVANTPEATTQAVAEHTLGLLFSIVRDVAFHDRSIKNGVWNQKLRKIRWHLYGKTMGLVGFGRIAQAVAKKCSGLEMTIIAHDPIVNASMMAELGVESVGFEELLKRSDVLSLHTPLLDQTYHLMGESQFRMMKADAIFINTSRGKVVDEAALQRALSEGWIAAAGLDVLEQEPPPETPPPPPEGATPILNMDNVVATPHIGGLSDESHYLFWDHSVRTLIELSKDRWPPWCVNPTVKPRHRLNAMKTD